MHEGGLTTTLHATAKVVANDRSQAGAAPRRGLLARLMRQRPSQPSAATRRQSTPPSDASARAQLYQPEDFSVDADLVYDRLEAGRACVHCCVRLEPLVSRVLSDEAVLRGEDARAKLAEWRQNGQLQYAPDRL